MRGSIKVAVRFKLPMAFDNGKRRGGKTRRKRYAAKKTDIRSKKEDI